jgi:uncharacterized protein (DUF697 family)
MEELQNEIAQLKAQVRKGAAAADIVDPHAKEAHKLIRYYSLCAAGGGLLTPPVLDLAAVTAVQLRLVKVLAKTYGKSFDVESGRALVTALSGALAPAFIGQGGIRLFLRAFGPGFVGGLLAGATIPALNYGSTDLVGRFFRNHFLKAGDEPANLTDLSQQLSASLAGARA